MEQSVSAITTAPTTTMTATTTTTSTTTTITSTGRARTHRNSTSFAAIAATAAVATAMLLSGTIAKHAEAFVVPGGRTTQYPQRTSKQDDASTITSTALYNSMFQQQQIQQYQAQLTKAFERRFVLDAQNPRKVLTARHPVPFINGRVNGHSVSGGTDAAMDSATHAVDPADIEFIPTAQLIQERLEELGKTASDSELCHIDTGSVSSNDDECSDYPPFARMLSGSARYIASHTNEIAVIYVPGELLMTGGGGNSCIDSTCKSFDCLVDDIALLWLMGLKVVVVAGCTSSSTTAIADPRSMQWDGWAAPSANAAPARHGHPLYIQSQSAHGHRDRTSTVSQQFDIPPVNHSTMRMLEENAGYVRYELERKLNKCLTRHVGLSPAAMETHGNVVGGNFFTTELYDTADRHTGYVRQVHVLKILAALQNKDIVLLTTMGASMDGDLVHVNGPYLAAKIAAECQAHKVIYLTNKDMVMTSRKAAAETGADFFQDVPVSFVESVLKQHNTRIHSDGFVVANKDSDVAPNAKMLQNLAWSAWALQHGVTRAHIVNSGDGALLEEMFTEQHGTNTCVYHDSENR